MYRRLLPVITEKDKELPYYLVDAGIRWNQEHIVRPGGYLHQWIQCVEGEGELLVGGRTYRVKEGNAMLLFKGVPHEYYAVSSAWIVNWVVFDGAMVEPFLKQTAGLQTSGVMYLSRPELFLAKIQGVMDIQQSDYTLKALQWSAQVYTFLTGIVQFASTTPDASASSLNLRLKPLLDYIHQHSHQQLTLETMAGVVGITPQHLCTLFKKATNIRIFQYINSVRIQKSKELLLLHPLKPVQEIARLAGFEDANYFSTVFKKHEQLTPNQYRRLHCPPLYDSGAIR
ncbi:AraC family transcriptional regulator ['Paenibacillus yunnanensis' Narsing Rao et al. 2020]|uniref:AraC family transcriptional regulator n=1 Tax=Paenibacillus tengchongensis TaxID=2608684 RepID=UPI00124EDC9B|nr:AraC family transcriptional regulator [Paenibacillus tengchongensis]